MADPARIWAVIDEDGTPIYCASYSEACHEHIFDAVTEDIDDAGKWLVREYVLADSHTEVEKL